MACRIPLKRCSPDGTKCNGTGPKIKALWYIERVKSLLGPYELQQLTMSLPGCDGFRCDSALITAALGLSTMD